ncbi:MAG: peptidoglycan DD-metalloendopeptidase family protein [Candidatus Obscuribacterales bacterium]|nr:peptidoglycan DD-metalloendopeptidase family protein [Candidatus Obscuribacterales bacterium]
MNDAWKNREHRALSMFVTASVMAAAMLQFAPSAPASASHHHTSRQEAEKHLAEVARKRKEARENAERVRKKERIAMAKLHKIKSQLRATTTELKANKNQLVKTETHLRSCETNLSKTADAEQNLSEGAAVRLREMYEGQRLGLLEAMFQVSSLQQLMDVLYYQERIAEQDRGLIDELRARERALAAQKNRLGSEKMKLGDIVSEFAKKALALNKEKSDQEQVADKLRTQRAFYEAAEQQLNRESSQLESQIMAMMRANKTTDKVVTRGSGTMSWPLRAAITSPFGYRRHPIFGVRKFHTGVDLAGPNHSAIKAADSGDVLYSGWYGGYGKVVIVGHGNGLATLYAHMSKAAVGKGENVKKGDVVGYEGSTGFSTGPHLHFEVRVDGKPNNPINFLH